MRNIKSGFPFPQFHHGKHSGSFERFKHRSEHLDAEAKGAMWFDFSDIVVFRVCTLKNVEAERLSFFSV